MSKNKNNIDPIEEFFAKKLRSHELPVPESNYSAIEKEILGEQDKITPQSWLSSKNIILTISLSLNAVLLSYILLHKEEELRVTPEVLTPHRESQPNTIKANSLDLHSADKDEKKQDLNKESTKSYNKPLEAIEIAIPKEQTSKSITPVIQDSLQKEIIQPNVTLDPKDKGTGSETNGLGKPIQSEEQPKPSSLNDYINQATDTTRGKELFKKKTEF